MAGVFELVPRTGVETHAFVARRRSVFEAGPTDASGSYTYSTGSAYLHGRRPPGVKSVLSRTGDEFVESVDADLRSILDSARAAVAANGECRAQLEEYMTRVNSASVSPELTTSFDVVRVVHGYDLDVNAVKKRIVHDQLFDWYRVHQRGCEWAVTNYYSLNFPPFGPQDAVLMYPNVEAGGASNVFLPTEAITFDVRVNTRYPVVVGSDVPPRTLLSLPGAYSLSIVTGSTSDVSGNVASHRILLQLSEDSLVDPTTAATSGVGHITNEVITSNTWHRVVVRIPSTNVNAGTGSIIVDDEVVHTFSYPSSSLTWSGDAQPNVLFVGAYYSGSVGDADAFFAADPARRHGVTQLNPTTGIDAPSGSFAITNRFVGEVHELRIWDRFLTLNEVRAVASSSIVADDDITFYVPAHFHHRSPFREVVDDVGGVLVTPFHAVDGTTDTPVAAELMFSVGGHYVNLENFTRDFANDSWPRPWNLTGSITSTGTPLTADEILYATASVRLRNMSVVPCDDGGFRPDFSLMFPTGVVLEHVPSWGDETFRYRDGLGAFDPSLVSLDDMVSTSSLLKSIVHTFGNLFDALTDAQVQAPPTTLAIAQRTRDVSSNAFVMFDVSNVFYSARISPGSVVLSDSALSGSDGSVSVTLRDAGDGVLYRADSTGEHATWAKVGTVLYDEGLIVVLDPTLAKFGASGFRLEFDGEHVVFNTKFRVKARAGHLNTSRNSSFIDVPASVDVPGDDPFVWVTGATLHDSNMNAVVKVSFAQPVLKRLGDELTFRVAVDF